MERVGINERAIVRMTVEEEKVFLLEGRTMTLATNSPSGHPHLVAMWYGLVDGAVCFETKVKSQKVRNLRRDPRISCLVEGGDNYDDLRGISLEGTADIVEDSEFLWRVGVSVWERYFSPYAASADETIARMLHNRVAIRVDAQRVRSWDHRKLTQQR